MSDLDRTATAGRIAVVDLGSNSLRLVVFERLGGALFPVLNEKVMCALGRGITSTGRLNAEGVTLALVSLRRFVALARALDVEHLAVLATAAVRDAIDGRSFAAEVERQCQVPVKILQGAEEARLSAAGMLAGIPDADGIVGMTEASTMRRPRAPRTRSSASTTASLPDPMAQVPTGWK